MENKCLIVFPPFVGGHHLGQLMSTALMDYTTEQIQAIYDLNKNNIDGAADYYFKYSKLYIGHLLDAVKFMQRHTDVDLIVLTYPDNWAGVLGKRIQDNSSQIVAQIDFYKYIYTGQSISRLLNIPPERSLEVSSQLLENPNVNQILDQLPKWGYKRDICQTMHNRWLTMITQ